MKIINKLWGWIRQSDAEPKQKSSEQVLRESKSATEAAAKAKSQFVANISHEIRTPMNGVLGFMELLQDTELDEDQREMLETAILSGKSLLSLLNNILDFAKIENEKFDLESIEFDLRALIDDLVALISQQAGRKQIDLAYMLGRDTPHWVMGDSTRVRQVLLNLLSNAIKFTKNGEVLLQISNVSKSNDAEPLLFSEMDDEQDSGKDNSNPEEKNKVQQICLRFEITDTGIGINESQIETIFEEFTQADSSTTRKFGGTGLGLAISKRLVETMGGQIGVYSEPGKGSTFWFTVNLINVDHQVTTWHPKMTLSGLKLLIVEADAANRMAMEYSLNRWGVAHNSALAADAAIVKLKAAVDAGRPFNIVILGNTEHGPQGQELVADIRTHRELDYLKMLLLKSTTGKIVNKEIKPAVVDAYLYKPIRQKKLYETLDSLMLSNRDQSPENIENLECGDNQNSTRLLFLVVENNEINQQIAVRFLNKLGHDAYVVENGQEAVEIVQLQKFNGVFMDLQMPVLDGFQATQQIRLHEGDRKHTPIIAMTAHNMPGDREKCLDVGMDDYIAKPVEIDVLRSVIRSQVC